jgi:hypothetical protein
MRPDDDEIQSPFLARMAQAICSAWPKTRDGCAPVCADRLDPLPTGCRHAMTVHGARARLVLDTPATVSPALTRRTRQT